jgi:parvulin-like peptidyl-prolyl isomerase
MKRGGLILFLMACVYLAGDWYILSGPLHRFVRGHDSPVARVFGHFITHRQLERAVHTARAVQGSAATRSAALDELIDHTLLRLQVQAHWSELPVGEGEIDTRMQRFTSRFETPAAMQSALKSEGISQIRERLRAQIQQEKFIELRTAAATQVSDEEALRWFTEHQAALAQPERVEARHVFLPTLDHPPKAAQEMLAAALSALREEKKDFATLARELSEDPATKDLGGNLGWMSRSRLPADFATPVFEMPLHQPMLIQTKLGWHLVEVTDRKPSEPRPFEQAKPEIIAALQAVKRREAVLKLRKQLREDAAASIQIF